jgi:HEPN domain-containing protein
MNRADLQKLTRLRLKEAKLLLDNKHYEGAYYLLGYAVECALKACIAKQTKRYDFPDFKRVKDSYTHDLNALLKLSGLEPEYRKETGRNASFEVNWSIVKDWSEQSRYLVGMSGAKAKDFRSAVASRKNGILPWLQKWW